MKEFEKWESGNVCNVPSDVDCCDIDCHDACKEIKAVGWRAALEEISSQLKRPTYSADIMKWIEEELEGGD